MSTRTTNCRIPDPPVGTKERLWILRTTDGNESEPRREHLAAKQEGCAVVLISPPFVIAAPFPASPGASVLLRTTTGRPAEDVPTLQEPPPDRGLSVCNDNPRTAELHLAPGAVVDRLPSLDPETSPSLKTTMHAESDALPQDAKVAQSRLDSSPMLRRDSHIQKEVIRTLLRFVDVISIGSYGKTNLISPASTVDPGTTPIRMKQRPLNPVKKESLWRQVDQRVEQRVVEEVYLPWSFPLAPVLKRNSREVRWAIAYRQMNAIPREDISSPDYRHVPQDKGWPIYDLGTDDHGSLFSSCFLFSPSLRGHDYQPRNISCRWPEATPSVEKFEWQVANFRIDSSRLPCRKSGGRFFDKADQAIKQPSL